MRDEQGHRLLGATSTAVDHFDRAVRAFTLGYRDALGLFDAAIREAPEFAMAHIGKTWVLMHSNDPTMIVAARPIISAVRALPLNQREQAHLAALEHALEGNRTSGEAILDRHLMHYPFDLVAHFAALRLSESVGRFASVGDRSARALPLWSKTQPSYGILRAMYAFGLEEGGDYVRSENVARSAAELEPDCYWVHHAISHVKEMTGRPDEGLEWISSHEPHWSTPDHAARVHIWWHRALFHIELDQVAEALAMYDGPILATQKVLGQSLTNASALLWRLESLGCQTGDRWKHLAALWETHADGRLSAFTDIHAAMAEIGAGQTAALEHRLSVMRSTAADGSERAPVYRDVGIPAVQGLAAFHRGDFARATEILLPVRVDLWKIGGSKAQRDVIDWTLTEAAVRSGDRNVALAMAHERLATRPASVPNRSWLRRAEAIPV